MHLNKPEELPVGLFLQLRQDTERVGGNRERGDPGPRTPPSVLTHVKGQNNQSITFSNSPPWHPKQSVYTNPENKNKQKPHHQEGEVDVEMASQTPQYAESLLSVPIHTAPVDVLPRPPKKTSHYANV